MFQEFQKRERERENIVVDLLSIDLPSLIRKSKFKESYYFDVYPSSETLVRIYPCRISVFFRDLVKEGVLFGVRCAILEESSVANLFFDNTWSDERYFVDQKFDFPTFLLVPAPHLYASNKDLSLLCLEVLNWIRSRFEDLNCEWNHKTQVITFTIKLKDQIINASFSKNMGKSLLGCFTSREEHEARLARHNISLEMSRYD